jgi:putative heavy-metal-binding protein
MPRCSACGEEAPFLVMSKCNACLASPGRASEAIRRREDATPIGTKAANVKLTTAPHLEGYRVTETLDIVAAECVFGINLLRDLLAAMTDILGGRSETSQAALRDARTVCLRELRREAAAHGGCPYGLASDFTAGFTRLT